MSSSQHPVALRLERQVGGVTKLLATVMGLPLVDGIFPALVLAGGLDSPAGIVQVGLLVFGGSATVAVILAEMDGTPREQAKTVLLVGTGIIALAGLEAAFAPTIASALDLHVFERFAALVVAAIAAKTASARIGEYLPGPGVIVGLGLLASLQPSGFELVLVPDYALVARAVGAAGVGVGFALAVALTAPHLREIVDVDRFRFGSAVALGVLPLSLLGFAPGRAPLAVLVVTGMLAFDPGSTVEDAVADTPESQTAATEAMTTRESSQTVVTDGSGSNDDAIGSVADSATASHSGSVADAASVTESESVAESDPAPESDDAQSDDYPGELGTDEREPWL